MKSINSELLGKNMTKKKDCEERITEIICCDCNETAGTDRDPCGHIFCVVPCLLIVITFGILGGVLFKSKQGLAIVFLWISGSLCCGLLLLCPLVTLRQLMFGWTR